MSYFVLLKSPLSTAGTHVRSASWSCWTVTERCHRDRHYADALNVRLCWSSSVQLITHIWPCFTLERILPITLTCATDTPPRETIVNRLQNSSPAMRKFQEQVLLTHTSVHAPHFTSSRKSRHDLPRALNHVHRPLAADSNWCSRGFVPCFHAAPPDGRRTLSVLSLASLLV